MAQLKDSQFSVRFTQGYKLPPLCYYIKYIITFNVTLNCCTSTVVHCILSGITVEDSLNYREKPKSGLQELTQENFLLCRYLSRTFGALRCTCMTGDQLPPSLTCQRRAVASTLPGLGVFQARGVKWCQGTSRVVVKVASQRTVWVNWCSFVLTKNWKKIINSVYSFLCYERIQICIHVMCTCNRVVP